MDRTILAREVDAVCRLSGTFTRADLDAARAWQP
jgi:hypothetical protein